MHKPVSFYLFVILFVSFKQHTEAKMFVMNTAWLTSLSAKTKTQDFGSVSNSLSRSSIKIKPSLKIRLFPLIYLQCILL